MKEGREEEKRRKEERLRNLNEGRKEKRKIISKSKYGRGKE